MAETLTLRLDGEAPAIGSGVRKVQVISVGPKWATIRAARGGRRVRLRRKVWDRVINARTNRGGST